MKLSLQAQIKIHFNNKLPYEASKVGTNETPELVGVSHFFFAHHLAKQTVVR